MRRSFKFLMRPTAKQAVSLAAMVDDHRQLYNAALEERRTAYRKRAATVLYGDQSAQLKEIRAMDPEGQGRWSAASQQQTLRRLDRAFAAFFRRVRAGQKPGYPRFKGQGWFDTLDFVQGNGAKWDSQPHHPTATYVRIHGIGHVRVHQHRPVAGQVKTVSVKREGTHWFVIVSCQDVPAVLLPPAGREIGVDLGVVHYATVTEPISGLTDEQGHISDPRYRKTLEEELAAAQRAYARTKRGSRRRKKAAQRIGGIHRKIGRRRKDHAHKTALALVRHADLIAVEDLRVSNMTRRSAPRPAEDGGYAPNGASAKTGLNKAILDAGWGVFLSILSGKAESAGRQVISVDPTNTSRTCPRPDCRHVSADSRRMQAEFACVRCGHADNADRVAALNTLRAGLALREAASAA